MWIAEQSEVCRMHGLTFGSAGLSRQLFVPGQCLALLFMFYLLDNNRFARQKTSNHLFGSAYVFICLKRKALAQTNIPEAS